MTQKQNFIIVVFRHKYRFSSFFITVVLKEKIIIVHMMRVSSTVTAFI